MHRFSLYLARKTRFSSHIHPAGANPKHQINIARTIAASVERNKFSVGSLNFTVQMRAFPPESDVHFHHFKSRNALAEMSWRAKMELWMQIPVRKCCMRWKMWCRLVVVLVLWHCDPYIAHFNGFFAPV